MALLTEACANQRNSTVSRLALQQQKKFKIVKLAESTLSKRYQSRKQVTLRENQAQIYKIDVVNANLKFNYSNHNFLKFV